MCLFYVFHQLPNQVYPQIRIDGARSGYRWQAIFPIPVIILVFYNEIGGNSSHTGCIGSVSKSVSVQAPSDSSDMQI